VAGLADFPLPFFVNRAGDCRSEAEELKLNEVWSSATAENRVVFQKFATGEGSRSTRIVL